MTEMSKCSQKTKYARLADFQRCMVTFSLRPMPALMSDRSFVSVHDSIKNYSDGSLTLIRTDKGAEKIINDYSPFFKKTTRGDLHFGVTKIIPTEGGVEVQ